MDFTAHQPVIILGMHRSGTTLMTRLLSDLGLFTGAWISRNHEAHYFLDCNEWALQKAGGAWDYIHPFERVLQQPAVRDELVERFRAYLASWHFVEFAGLRRRSWFTKNPWGWKDPRSIVVLPIWLRVFPRARLLYITRNGIDVANSIHKLSCDSLKGRETPFTPAPLKHRLGGVIRSFDKHGSRSVRCLDWGESFTLWEEYCEVAEKYFESYDGPKQRIRFEDLLADPEPKLTAAADFCGLATEASVVASISASTRSDRGYAFLRSPGSASESTHRDEATPPFKQHADLLRRSTWLPRLGYEDVLDALDRDVS